MEEEAGAFPLHRQKRVLPSPRPLGHDWVYCLAVLASDRVTSVTQAPMELTRLCPVQPYCPHLPSRRGESGAGGAGGLQTSAPPEAGGACAGSRNCARDSWGNAVGSLAQPSASLAFARTTKSPARHPPVPSFRLGTRPGAGPSGTAAEPMSGRPARPRYAPGMGCAPPASRPDRAAGRARVAGR